jgi:hypothetical protein
MVLSDGFFRVWICTPAVAIAGCLRFLRLDPLRHWMSVLATEHSVWRRRVLEHIRDDQGMVHLFWDLLRPGGTLQLCCPNAAHPEHNLGRVNGPEDGGHVRDGYTLESYRKLLEPVGFVIERHLGLGSHILTTLDRPIRQIRNRFGDVAALPFFAINWPVTYVFDRPNPPMPYSLHVVARKPNLSEP